MWLTVPVLSKGMRDQAIAQVEIDRSADFHLKQLKTISHIYGKAPYFESCFKGLEETLCAAHSNLAELNIELINRFCQTIGITSQMVRSSSLGIEGQKVDLLLGICQAVGADSYLSPLGSQGYIQENDIFADNGIELRYQDFRHPQYTQLHGEFVPYLSALDLLMNEGPASLDIIRSGREEATASGTGH